jgi:hypothetical protein
MDDEWVTETGSLIESSEGFSVRRLGITGIRYTENGRSVWIDSEILATRNGAILHKESIKTWEDESANQVSEADRNRIVSNIKRAFEFLGYELVVHVPYPWRADGPPRS